LCDKLRDTGKKQKTKTGLIFTKTSYLYCTIITVFSRTQINNLENQPNNPVIPAPFLKIIILEKNKNKRTTTNKQTKNHFTISSNTYNIKS